MFGINKQFEVNKNSEFLIWKGCINCSPKRLQNKMKLLKNKNYFDV